MRLAQSLSLREIEGERERECEREGEREREREKEIWRAKGTAGWMRDCWRDAAWSPR